jgi:hypothetical protein
MHTARRQSVPLDARETRHHTRLLEAEEDWFD